MDISDKTKEEIKTRPLTEMEEEFGQRGFDYLYLRKIGGENPTYTHKEKKECGER